MPEVDAFVETATSQLLTNYIKLQTVNQNMDFGKYYSTLEIGKTSNDE
jgi:hypothetical protein